MYKIGQLAEGFEGSWLARNATGQRHPLLSSVTIIGRGARADIRLDEHFVSSLHAQIRWDGSSWLIRDLGSTNGTTVNGNRVSKNSEVPLLDGSVITFGSGEGWTMTGSAPPPRVAALNEATGAIVCGKDALLAVPSSERASATLFVDSSGGWVVEQGSSVLKARDGMVVDVDGASWRIVISKEERLHDTQEDLQPLRRLDDLTFNFVVSSDNEQVELRLNSPSGPHVLKNRGFIYLLLELARQRIDDTTSKGLTEPESGWVYVDDICSRLACRPEQMNVDIFRIRRWLVQVGIADAANVIERERSGNRLRVGATHLTIQSGLPG